MVVSDGWAPMLARLDPSLPQGPNWVYEPKWDGFRALLIRQGANVRILSRNWRRLEPWFPELVAIALKSLPEHCALDGEILGIRDGKPEFSTLLARLGGRGDSQVQFIAFDVLEVEGENLAALPLMQRRSLLIESLPEGQSSVSATVQTDMFDVATNWLERSRELGIEGVVAKRAAEPYRYGRRSWVKVKHWDTVDLVVGGCTGTPDRLSLLLGAYDQHGSLTYVGQTTTLPAPHAAPVASFLQVLACDQSFGNGPTPGYSRWDSHRFDGWIPLRPVLVCEVSFSRLDGHFLRHSARFVRWRPDKEPKDCKVQGLQP